MKIVYCRSTYFLYGLVIGQKHNLHIIPKFGCLHATYSLSVHYLSSKHDSRLVMGLDI